MVKKYKTLKHINVDHMALVRTDKRERWGKRGTTSATNKAILKMMVASNGRQPRCKVTGQFMSPAEFNKLMKEQGE
jgi:hypothetical protein|tara:strand:+ start:786 stop:1013 length:228 start_codon:yes stop_codon:yes gene_type:complete